MQGKIVWQKSSTKPENPSNFAFISQWWTGLANKKITFAQRLIPQSGEVDERKSATPRLTNSYWIPAASSYTFFFNLRIS